MSFRNLTEAAIASTLLIEAETVLIVSDCVDDAIHRYFRHCAREFLDHSDTSWPDAERCPVGMTLLGLREFKLHFAL